MIFRKINQEIHQSFFIVAVCVGIVVGTILALVFRVKFFASPLFILLAIFLIVFVYFKPKVVFIIFAIVAGIVLASFRVGEELKGEDYIRQFFNQEVVVYGEVDGDPETDETGTKIKLKNLGFGENGEHKTSGNIFISARQNEMLKRGDGLVLKGKIAEGFGTYAGYMYKPAIVRILRPEPGNLVIKIRDWFAGRIARLVSEPKSSLGLSYLLGMRTGLPEDLASGLRAIGLMHIINASGAHLSILVSIVRKIFGRLSRMTGVLFAIIFIILFMIMVGFTPSIMRAGIMAILTLVAGYVGREFKAWRIILIVAATTLMHNPMYLINLGWLLSFASYFGIMVLGPRLANFFYGEREPKFVASMVITTMAATLMTLPITLYYFGTVSLIMVLVNLLILPTLPYAMGLVFLTGLLAGIFEVETIVAFLTDKVLDFHILVVKFFGEIRSFVIEIETGKWQVFLIYIIILLPFFASFLGWFKKNMVKSGHGK